VRVDGKDVGKSPLQGAIKVGAGEHLVTVERDGFATSESTVSVVGEESRRLVIALEPPRTPRVSGHVLVECALAGVRILVDSRPIGTTPPNWTTPMAQELELPAGSHVLTFERDGYRAQPRAVEVTSSGALHVSCEIAAIIPVPEAIAARLSVLSTERGAWTRVDGAPFTSGSALPPGPHHVEVGKAGFDAWTIDVDLPPGDAQAVRAALRPLPEYAHAFEESAKRQRYAAYLAGAAGLVTGAAALVVFAWNDARYRDWERAQSSLDQEWRASSTPASGDLTSRQQTNDDRIGSVHTWDAVDVALGVGSIVLLATGAVLFFTGDDPERYLRPQLSPGRVGLECAF
jgi:hypothetical protein